MRNKIYNLALIIFCLGFTLNAAISFAQSQTKDFGWSLKRFENNRKQEKKDKKQKKERHSVRNSLPNLTANTSANSQNSSGDNRQAASDDEIIRIETNLVINDILVVDEKGTAVPNLKPEDFIVSEDGAEQKVELFAYGENAKLPRSIVLIFYNGFESAYTVKNSIEATSALIDKLASQDKMAIVTHDLKLILPFTKDKNLLKTTLKGLSPNLQSNIEDRRDYGTLMAVLNEVFDETDVRPIVIFQTNGREIYGLKPDSDTPSVAESARKTFTKFQDGERNYGFSDIKDSIVKSRATIYSIIPAMRFVGLPREEQLRRAKISIEAWKQRAHGETSSSRIADAVEKYQSAEVFNYVSEQTGMIEVAKLSGGYTEFIEKSEDAVKVYSTIFAVINNRYTIGYYPTNQAKDSKLRRVKITVRGHPEYMILGRESYFAPGK